MRHLEIIIPFGLPPADMAPALTRELHMPALAKLVGRAKALPRMPEFEPFARVLPHGAWLAYQFGLTAGIEADNSPAVATAGMQWLGLPTSAGFWFILNPVHIDVGMDQMVLADRRHLQLAEAESRQLFDAAKASFERSGKIVLYGNATTWFVRADDWKDLHTSTPDAACGRNLRHWMPEGAHELEWRKLHNEVQMLWHRHPVNIAREQRGAGSVNALWLWGGASGTMPTLPAIVSFTATYKLPNWISVFGQFSPVNMPECTITDLRTAPPKHGLLLLDNLIEPTLNNDWQQWIAIFQQLEDDWLAPLLTMLEQQQLDCITLHLSNDVTLATFISDRQSLRKFWRRKSLARLQ